MKELNIGGFDHDEEQAASPYLEEMNTLKIDKLSNRVTIISIIIPCIICAILVFGYFDMQETVLDVNIEKQTKVMEVTKQFGEKTNALNVELAKLQSMLEKKLPEIEKKITKLEASIAKASSTKADKSSVKKDIAKINSNNSKYKTRIDKIAKTSRANQTLINSSKTKLEKDISSIDNKLNTKLNQIDEYENSVAITMKNLSILKKRYDEFKKDSLTKKALEAELDNLNQAFNKKLERLEQKISTSLKNNKPKPVEKQEIPEKEPSKEPATKTGSNDKLIVEESIEE